MEVWNEGDKLGDGRGVRRSPACLMRRKGLCEGFSMSCEDFLPACANNNNCSISFNLYNTWFFRYVQMNLANQTSSYSRFYFQCSAVQKSGATYCLHKIFSDYMMPCNAHKVLKSVHVQYMVVANPRVLSLCKIIYELRLIKTKAWSYFTTIMTNMTTEHTKKSKKTYTTYTKQSV